MSSDHYNFFIQLNAVLEENKYDFFVCLLPLFL